MTTSDRQFAPVLDMVGDAGRPALLAPVAPRSSLAAVADEATRLAKRARAAATQRAYRADWSSFTRWCDEHHLAALPAEATTVALFLAGHAETLAVATLVRRLSSIATAHRQAGYHFDTKTGAIQDVLGGIKRTRGTAQRHAEALTTDLIRRLVATCGGRTIDIRDKALLLLGFAGAFRRSELAALEVADLVVTAEGLRVTIRRSKGDQQAQGQVIAISRTGSPHCPVAAYEEWLRVSGITGGRALRSVDRHGRVGPGLEGLAVAKIAKRRAALAGLDPAAISGHSLRAGLATSAAQAGVEDRVIAKTTRHASMDTLRRYIRDGQLFQNALTRRVGL